ncbi:FAD-binding oxidoreductase [Dactylosporangium sp. NPDC048998]|uniref:FAD-binding oxidoreductase n=1 Tax=Dactylosporangium sp. NPDC048998 TaxID=3363976 RepID=UPI00371256ED
MDPRTDSARAAGEAARELRDTFRGDLLLPRDQRYETARRVWNGSIDRYPGLIARCADTGDVIAALRAARRHGLEVAVRGGGHSIAGHGVADGAVTIDLSRMATVQVDADARRVTVQAGSLLSGVDRETQRHGLAVTSGFVSHTGVAGLTLGGGFGWMARKHGLACDNLRSARVVLADGSHAVAGMEDDADLLWALRGGGGNFGIVTSFEFDLHRVGPMVTTGAGLYDLDDGRKVLELFRELAAEATDETTWAASVWDVEPGSSLPQEYHGKPVVSLAFVHIGDVEHGVATGRRLRGVAQPLDETVGPVPYLEVQTSNDAAWSHGMRRYWKSHYLWELPDAAIDTFLARGTATLGGGASVAGSLLARGGAIGRTGEHDSAVGHRGALFEFMASTGWADPDEDETRRSDVRTFADRMARFGRGVYVNNLDIEGEDRVRDAYGVQKYQRLAALKARFDPDNVFHLNQNIRPATASAARLPHSATET